MSIIHSWFHHYIWSLKLLEIELRLLYVVNQNLDKDSSKSQTKVIPIALAITPFSAKFWISLAAT